MKCCRLSARTTLREAGVCSKLTGRTGCTAANAARIAMSTQNPLTMRCEAFIVLRFLSVCAEVRVTVAPSWEVIHSTRALPFMLPSRRTPFIRFPLPRDNVMRVSLGMRMRDTEQYEGLRLLSANPAFSSEMSA